MSSAVRSAGLWWIRRDLRATDNEALTGACDFALDTLLPVYCFDPRDIGPRQGPPQALGVPRLGPLRCRLLLEGLLELQQELEGLPQRQQQQEQYYDRNLQHQQGSPRGEAIEQDVEEGRKGRTGTNSGGSSGSGRLWIPSAVVGGSGGRLIVRFGPPEEVLPALLSQVHDSNPELRRVSLHHHLDLMYDSVQTERRVAEALGSWARQRGLELSVHTYWDRTLYHPDDLPYQLYSGGQKGAPPPPQQQQQRHRLRSAQMAGSGSESGAAAGADAREAAAPASSLPPPNSNPARFRSLPPVMTDFRKVTQAAARVRPSLPKPGGLPPLPSPFRDRDGTPPAPAAACGGGDGADAGRVPVGAGGPCALRGEVPLTVAEVYDAVGATDAFRRLEELVGLDYRTLLLPVVMGTSGDPAFRPDPRTAFPFRAGHDSATRRLRYYVWGQPKGPGPSAAVGGGQPEAAQCVPPPSLQYFTNTRAQAVGVDNSTKLSPYVALGCITPRQIHAEVERVRAAAAAAAEATANATVADTVTVPTPASAETPIKAEQQHPVSTALANEVVASGTGSDVSQRLHHRQGADGTVAGGTAAAAAAVPPGSGLAPPAECDWLSLHLCIRDFFIFTALKEGEAMMDERGIAGKAVSWRREEETFRRWARGMTGLPFVDANMRELAATGWMSNRGRQNVASFLAKDLGLDWRWGAELFECLLLDADVAVNYCNWNYFAGIGNDPRNRHFKTVTQGIKYDEDALLAAAWLPELCHLPAALRHQPWTMTEAESVQYGVVLGRDYPQPMVDIASQVGQLGGKEAKTAGKGPKRRSVGRS